MSEEPAFSFTEEELVPRSDAPPQSGLQLTQQGEPVSGDDAWRELLDGRWSLVDRYDRAGRRFWIARRNDAAATEEHRLAPLERRVVGQLVHGCSQKHIAYELGLAESTVSKHAAGARTKLGLKTCAELIELYATLLGKPA